MNSFSSWASNCNEHERSSLDIDGEMARIRRERLARESQRREKRGNLATT